MIKRVYSTRKKRFLWQYDIWVNGRRYRDSSLETKQEAEDAVAAARRGALHVRYNTDAGLQKKLFKVINTPPAVEPDAARVALLPEVQKLFDKFCDLSNRSYLQEKDWERFYQFARAFNSGRDDMTASDIGPLLMDAGFPDPKIHQLIQALEHCMGVLTLK